MNYKIQINGSGTPEKIAERLLELGMSIQSHLSEGIESELDGAEWEDDTLITTIESLPEPTPEVEKCAEGKHHYIPHAIATSPV